ncbi:hypothetical protein, variant [Phialophora macrospora]|uniref:Tautomerase cis-CaaD-like domain-containing protein n=1 Tax=Phialophora macrospora TaxID=1851006 RepID=A0A0D2CIS8_9EURO|nr:hypothetical protein PV04_07433 [Phialophora macrospora]KIW65152.1 hypothetical protein, variant [Phialophora macrospora]
MPFYEVQHTYPLTLSQKHAFAKAITELHSTTFLTPSLFVNVSFHLLQPRNEENTYFLAGEPVAHNNAGPNRVLAMVRTSPNRTKAIWDDLAGKLEEKWYEVVDGEKPNGHQNGDANGDTAAKKLHFITFYPMLAARENGVTIPDAGSESSWLRDNMPFFKSQAYEHGDENFRKMIDEIDTRDDLKAMLKA